MPVRGDSSGLSGGGGDRGKADAVRSAIPARVAANSSMHRAASSREMSPATTASGRGRVINRPWNSGAGVDRELPRTHSDVHQMKRGVAAATAPHSIQAAERASSWRHGHSQGRDGASGSSVVEPESTTRGPGTSARRRTGSSASSGSGREGSSGSDGDRRGSDESVSDLEEEDLATQHVSRARAGQAFAGPTHRVW
jgi:hypothetical protein